jgi:hypothetical protein
MSENPQLLFTDNRMTLVKIRATMLAVDGDVKPNNWSQKTQ